ncbi:hypothetical protein [Glaciecola sp. SC05]|uniref:hypothetical protein n=1 Tax=Glaciecola sp. SC05 TaxID=1987355 RepID=UPI0035292F6B
MKTFNLLAFAIVVNLFFLSSFANAKLIIRGGASGGLGGGGETRYLAPVGTPSLIQDVDLPVRINSQGASPLTSQAIPFSNRNNVTVPSDQRCDPQVCEYNFNLKDPFTLQGFGDFYGADLGVTASYQWGIFEETTFFVDANGFTRALLGDEVRRFDASSFSTVPNSHVDVFLDTTFPLDLRPGDYTVALITIYTAPTDTVFGKFDPNLSVGINGETFYQWDEIGRQFEFETQRFDLTLVSTPYVFGLFSLAMLGLLRLRKRSM